MTRYSGAASTGPITIKKEEVDEEGTPTLLKPQSWGRVELKLAGIRKEAEGLSRG